MRAPFQIALATLIGLGSALPTISAAEAHAFLVQSFPSPKQRLMTPLSTVKLRFAGKADALYSTVSLARDDGSVLARRIQPEASRDFHLPAPPLEPGRYRVHYRILSTDGDIVEGQLDFVVDASNANESSR